MSPGSFCKRTAPIAFAEASVWTSTYSAVAGSNIYKTGALHTLSRNTSNACYYAKPQTNAVPFLVSSVSGKAIAENPLINLRKNYTKPKKLYKERRFVGTGHSLTLLTFYELMDIPSDVISNPRKVVLG